MWMMLLLVLPDGFELGLVHVTRRPPIPNSSFQRRKPSKILSQRLIAHLVSKGVDFLFNLIRLLSILFRSFLSITPETAALSEVIEGATEKVWFKLFIECSSPKEIRQELPEPVNLLPLLFSSLKFWSFTGRVFGSEPSRA